MEASIGGSLLSFLAKIPDPRSRHGRQHPLSAILGLTCCAIMCGAKSYTAIGQWAQDQDIAFMHRLGFTRTPPKMGGIRKVLMALDAMAFEDALTRWAGTFLNEPVSSEQTSLDAFALDGKSARGSFDGLEKAVHLLSLMAHKSGLTLAQTPVPNGGDDKTNEHKTALRLLEGLVLKGRVITGDAMFCQRDLSKQVIDQQGHFLWFVKENQPTLLHDIEMAFAPSVEGDFSPSAATNLGRGHGHRDIPRQGARSSGTSNVKGNDGVERVSGLARRRPSGTSRAGSKAAR
jgi:predicted transposase YbfD/YdcC